MEFTPAEHCYDEILRAWPFSQLNAADYAATMPLWKAHVFAFISLRNEVCNGGFSQYFFNRKGDLLGLAIQAASAVGNAEMKELLSKAESVWKVSARQVRRAEQASALVRYLDFRSEVPDLNALDHMFYELNSIFEKQLDEYVEQHAQR